MTPRINLILVYADNSGQADLGPAFHSQLHDLAAILRVVVDIRAIARMKEGRMNHNAQRSAWRATDACRSVDRWSVPPPPETN